MRTSQKLNLELPKEKRSAAESLPVFERARSAGRPLKPRNDLPPYVYMVRDRHGTTRYRFIRRGWPSRYLKGVPGTAEFFLSYEDCQDRNYTPKPRLKPTAQRAFKGIALRPQQFVGGNWVYFIGGMTGPVKIGTTVNLPARLKKLQTGSSRRLYVLACIPGDASIEAEYHQRFSEWKINGEWFASRVVRDEIKRIRQTDDSNIQFQPVSNAVSIAG